MDQQTLLDGCKKQHRDAQKTLFETYKNTLFLTSLKYCKNEQTAEDNLHDAFITIFENIKKFKGKGSLEGWMRRITINKAIDRFKKDIVWNAELPLHLEEHELIATTDLNVDLDQILASIQELPDQYRLVFSLYQLDHYSHKEIATILSISEGTSKSNYHRAKKILREKLSQKIDHPTSAT